MLLVLMTMSGCADVSTSAICNALLSDVDAHTVALVADGGPMSKATGKRLIAGFDGACDV